MSGGIYLIQDGGQLVEMKEQAYDSEALLQELLAKYPNLLAGDQMDSSAPRRWLLISREISVPSGEDSAGQWAVDHLFLDQDAIPTLVEVKRSTNTDIRRKVVGQILDYAANAVVYWPIERIRSQFEENCRNSGIDPEPALDGFLEGADQEEFWQQAKTNLQAGRVRLVFVADEIPAELQRIVEFLNGQMDPAEVLAVEIRQYVGQGLKTLVPRVIGQTAEAQPKKPGERQRWDEQKFFDDARNTLNESEVEAIRTLYEFSKRSAQISWGTGYRHGSFNPKFPKISGKSLYSVYSHGMLQINFGWLDDSEATEKYRDDFKRELEKLKGITIPEDYLVRYVSIPIEVWAPIVNDFIKVVEGLLAE